MRRTIKKHHVARAAAYLVRHARRWGWKAKVKYVSKSGSCYVVLQRRYDIFKARLADHPQAAPCRMAHWNVLLSEARALRILLNYIKRNGIRKTQTCGRGE